MLVKALREHRNNYGSEPVKTKDTEYELPDNMAKTLVAAGLVAEVKAKAEKPA